MLHARWLHALQPRAGEVVAHIGAGKGYYTSILSQLVGPRGKVLAVECDAKLAARRPGGPAARRPGGTAAWQSRWCCQYRGHLR
ncbi:hypothetical protein [Comamonas antarctica]|uniref:hypothetical protein n=1 Tax=Comamonas antarctica TaxID=2743470 RepID=UPI0036F41B0B